jgi:hypothetical protein
MHIPTYNQNLVNQCLYPRHFGIFYSTIGYVQNLTNYCGANSVHDNIMEENPPQYMTFEGSY